MTTDTRVAITAASGQLGAEIVKATARLPATEVIGLARTPENALGLGVEIRPGDYDQPAQLRSSLESVEALLVVSGMDAPDKRIPQHRNVIEAARDAGVRKIVYTSIQGAEQRTAFSPIVQSNRQTEVDVRQSGMDWVIGRNGIYIEPDIEYVDSYVEAGGITNCAGDGRCGYTTRPELARAYARMLTDDNHNGQTYNLHGDAITQHELADYLNRAFGTELVYTPVSVEEFREERIAALGEFLGTVIAGIYEGIRNGAADNPSHYATAAGRQHVSWPDYFRQLASQQPTGAPEERSSRWGGRSVARTTPGSRLMCCDGRLRCCVEPTSARDRYAASHQQSQLGRVGGADDVEAMVGWLHRVADGASLEDIGIDRSTLIAATHDVRAYFDEAAIELSERETDARQIESWFFTETATGATVIEAAAALRAAGGDGWTWGFMVPSHHQPWTSL